MIARELARYRLDAVVLEKGVDVSPACTKASNSVVHADSGPPGTNIRRFTAESHELYERICTELAVPFNRCGELFVALDPDELPMLEARLEAAEAKGVEMKRLSPAEVLQLEPGLTPDVLGGALAPAGAVVYAFELAIALFENARANGVDFRFASEVRGARILDAGVIELETTGGPVRAAYVINAAGAWASRVAALFGDDGVKADCMLGQRVIMDRRLAGTVRHIVDRFTGSGVIVPTGHGNLLLGRADGDLVDDPEDAFASDRGNRTILDQARALVPALGRSDMVRSFAGVWAERDDILVEKSSACSRLVNVCLPPPGLTACPGSARHAVALLGELGLELEPNPDFNPIRESIPDVSEMSAEDRAALVARDSSFGRVVCRCETVTEGEIIEAIRRGARTVDGVKYRVRAGMGRCQGGFCGLRVMAILARELGLGMTSVTKKGDGSWLVSPRGFGAVDNAADSDDRGTCPDDCQT
jgi:glycerol-3-phosphate dehydrogenase